MPAPTPIVIRYGNAGALGGLAAAAGQSAFDRSSAQQDYENWLRRRAIDQELQVAALNRNTQLDVADMQFNARRNGEGGATMLQDAAGYSPRATAQRAGTVTTVAGRSQAPVQLVPADGSHGQGSASMTVYRPDQGSINGKPFTDEYNLDEQGRVVKQITSTAGEVMQPRGVFNKNREMVTSAVRSQMDYLRAIQGQIPDDKWNAMWVAAKSGQLKLDQLMDDARESSPNPSTRMNATERAQDRFQAESEELGRITSLGQQDQIQYARRRFGMQDPDIYSDQDALQALQSRTRQVAAFNQPATNSGGRTPSGGNVVKVQTPEQARQLPSGTFFQTPDGRTMRVP